MLFTIGLLIDFKAVPSVDVDAYGVYAMLLIKGIPAACIGVNLV